MSVSIKYKGAEIASASTEVTKTIKTAGKYCEADILVENTPDGGDAPVINPLSVTANGTYTAPSGVDGYSPINVNVPQGITPTGNINITDTNVTDVTNYATATIVDADLVASNIKKNVNILGVVGTFEGGGGSLPSVISKIDGGSYTPAADTNNYTISHNLGVAPKGYALWCDVPPEAVEGTQNYLIAATLSGTTYQQTIDSATYYAVDGSVAYRAKNGASATNKTTITTTNIGNYFTSTQIKQPYNMYSKAGVTYKWLAWA